MTPTGTATANLPGTSGGVTTPQGFSAAGVSAGIKRRAPGAEAPLDLALLVSETPATAAAVFTTNRAQAAPVILSRAPASARGDRATG